MFKLRRKASSPVETGAAQGRHPTCPSHEAPAPARHLLALEPRFLFDAAAVATGAEVAAAQVAAAQSAAALDAQTDVQTDAHGADAPTADGHAPDAATADRAADTGADPAAAGPAPATLDSALQDAGAPAPSTGAQIVFIDRAVPDAATLLQGIDPTAEVIFIEAGRDGLAQMAEALQGRTGLAAIHVLSHGDQGEFTLGGTRYDADTLATHAATLQAIGAALSADGDLLLYGCEVAGSEEGQRLIDGLAQWTGADVAASTDTTGAASLGGDWTLEASAGLVEARALAAPQWEKALATGPLENAPVLDLNGQTTGRFRVGWLHNTPGGTPDPDGYIPDVPSGTAGAPIFPGWDSQVLASVGPEVTGPGLTRTVHNTELWIGSIDHPDLATAMANGDYLQHTFTTVAGLPANTVIDRLFYGLGTPSRAGDVVPSHISVVVSDDNFATSQVLVDHRRVEAPTSGPWQGFILDTPDYALQAGTAYQVRIVFHDHQGATLPALWDDFQIGTATDPTGHTGTFTEGGPAVAIAPAAISIEQAGTQPLTGATATLTNPQAGDRLLVGGSAAAAGTIAGTTIAWTRTDTGVTFTGTGDPAQYQAALQQVQFQNTSEAPSAVDRTVQTTVRNATATSAADTTTIRVVPVNDAPVAVDDSAATSEDTPATGNVLANDTDVDNRPDLRVTGFTVGGLTLNAGQTATLAGVGTLLINADGSYTFTPAANYTGPVPVATYTVSDGALTDTGTLTVSITPVNDAPVALDDAATTAEDTPATGNVLANDSDLDSTGLSVSNFSVPGVNGGNPIAAGTPAVIPNVGTLVINADGSYTFTPAANYAGPVPVASYTVSDGALTDTGTLTLTLTPVNDPPVAVNDSASTAEDTPATGNVLANDSDPEGAPLAVASYTVPGVNGGNAIPAGTPAVIAGVGTLTIGSDGSYTFTPLANYTGAVPVATYTATDGSLTATGTLTLAITPVNDAPVAVDDSATLDEDGTATGNLLANDSDPDGPPSTVSSYTVPGVNGGNPIPAGTPAVIPNVGTLTVGSDGSYSFTPLANYNGPVPVATYTVTDGSLSDTATLTLTITAVNDAPVAVDDSATTPEDTPIVLNLLGNDSDADGQPLRVTHIDGQPLTAGTPVNVAGGTVTLNADGTVTFAPAADGTGAFSFGYTVADPTGATATATATVTVSAVNDPPVARNDSFATPEDTPVTITVLANDGDIDADLLAVTHIAGVAVTPGGAAVAIVENGVTLGSAQLQADGSIVFTPAANYHGAVDFDYSISDGAGGTATATASGTVAPVNDPPVAQDDRFTGWENAPTTINILGNDVDPDGTPLVLIEINGTAIHVGDPPLAVTGGTVVRNPDDTLTFTPTPNYNGPVNFDYTVRDPEGSTDTASVTGTLVPVPSPPTAFNDSYTLDEDRDTDGDGVVDALVLDVLANDTDPDAGAQLEVTEINGTAIVPGGSVTVTGGSVTLNPDGTLSFTPEPDYHGTPSFTYTLRDGNDPVDPADPRALLSTATVNLTITPVNDPPVAVDDSRSTPEDTPLTFNPLGNDSDAESDPLAITAIDGQPLTAGGPAVPVTGGSVTLNADGTLTFTPDPDSNTPPGTPRSFSYTVSDGQGGSDTATVEVAVTPVNDPPVAVDDAITVTEDTALTLDLLLNDSDADLDTLSITHIDGTPLSPGGTGVAVTGGTVRLNAAGQAVFDPQADYNGPISFGYTVSDGQGGSAAAHVSGRVTAVNDRPVALDDSATTDEDAPATGNVLANDSDVDGPARSVTEYVVPGVNNDDPIPAGTPADIPNVGTLVIAPDGSYTFTPLAHYDGPVPVATYTVSDGTLSDTATLTLTITPVNDLPVASAPPLSTAEDTPVTGRITASDADGDPLSYTVATPPQHGTLALNPDGSYVYTPDPDYHGPDSFTITVDDGAGGTVDVPVPVTVTAVNDVPVASAPPLSTQEDTPVSGRITASDDDGDPLTYTVATPPQHGTLTLNPDGSYDYTPDPNYNGPDSFTLTVTDGQGGVVDVPVPVTVTGVNDLPVASAPPLSTREDTPVTGQVTASDVDGDPLTYTLSTPPRHGTLALRPDGVYVYTPDPNFNGPDSFILTVDDGQGGVVDVPVPVTVTGINDAPVASAPPLRTAEDTPVTGQVTATDSDGNPLTYSVGTPPQHGTLTLNPDGSYLYTPDPNFHGPDSFTITVDDGQGGVVDVPVPVTVTAVNDVPVASAPPLSTPEDTPVTGWITASDDDGNPLTYTISTPPQHGTLTLNPDGSYIYTPDPNFNGPDTFTITVDDGQGGILEIPVPVTVLAVNDAPVARPDIASSDGTPVVLDVLANDFDVEGGPLTITHIDGQPIAVGGTVPVQGGTVTLQGDGTLRFAPMLGYAGSPSFSYTVADLQGATAQGRVAVGVDPYPAADVQQLVNMGAVGPQGADRSETVLRDAERREADATMVVPPYLLGAVNHIRSLQGTAPIDVREPLRAAVHGIRSLQPLPSLDVAGPLLDVVEDLQQRFRIVDPAQALFERGQGDPMLQALDGGALVLPAGGGEAAAPAPAPLFSEQLESHALRTAREAALLARALQALERESMTI